MVLQANAAAPPWDADFELENKTGKSSKLRVSMMCGWDQVWEKKCNEKVTTNNGVILINISRLSTV